MRTARLSLIAVAIVVATLGLGASALGQSEAPADQASASYFTATWAPIEGGETASFEASDQRISGTMSQLLNIHEFTIGEPDGGESGALASFTVRIDNDAGAWVGTRSAMYGAPSGPTEWNVLRGEGAHDGLTAVFVGRDVDDIHGFIVPGGFPPLPDPVAPPAE